MSIALLCATVNCSILNFELVSKYSVIPFLRLIFSFPDSFLFWKCKGCASNFLSIFKLYSLKLCCWIAKKLRTSLKPCKGLKYQLTICSCSWNKKIFAGVQHESHHKHATRVLIDGRKLQKGLVTPASPWESASNGLHAFYKKTNLFLTGGHQRLKSNFLTPREWANANNFQLAFAFDKIRWWNTSTITGMETCQAYRQQKR